MRVKKGESKILTELPQKGGKNDCERMAGMTLELLYNDIIYNVKIISYTKEKGKPAYFEVEYNNSIKFIHCGSFIKGYFGGVLGLITKDFKFNMGDNIKDKNRDITITDRWYETDAGNIIRKYYKYKCNKCGWTEGLIEESNLLKGKGCSCCTNQVVVENINSIWATDRWLCDLGLSEQDAKTHTRGSGDKTVVICPYCGEKKEIVIRNLCKNKSIGCTCGDGFSYGHKYVYSMLKQNNIDFQDNVIFDWCRFKDYKKDKIRSGEYDFVIEDIKTIIEVDGGFHRKDNKMSGQTKEESQYIDEMKDKLAKEHGYKVIRVYYDDNNLEIKKHILESDIVNVIRIDNTNWLKCEEFALKNLVKEVCDYWNDKHITNTELSKIFNISRRAIRAYLQKGAELGWCDYESNKSAQ